jgi:hypothetical protein
MRAAKAKAVVLHPKAKDVEVEAKEKAPDLPQAKDGGGTRTPRKLQPPRPSLHPAPSTRKVRPPRDLPHLTKANAVTVASTDTKLGTVANASMRNQRKLSDRQITVSQPKRLPSMLTKTI